MTHTCVCVCLGEGERGATDFYNQVRTTKREERRESERKHTSEESMRTARAPIKDRPMCPYILSRGSREQRQCLLKAAEEKEGACSAV